MRATIADVARHPSWFRDWWFETPWKRPRNWWTLLTMPGRGWLRWKADTYPTYDYIGGVGHAPGPDMVCLPPLRRALLPLRNLLAWLGHGGGWVTLEEGRVRLSMQEFGVQRWRQFANLRDPEWPDDYLLP